MSTPLFPKIRQRVESKNLSIHAYQDVPRLLEAIDVMHEALSRSHKLTPCDDLREHECFVCEALARAKELSDE